MIIRTLIIVIAFLVSVFFFTIGLYMMIRFINKKILPGTKIISVIWTLFAYLIFSGCITIIILISQKIINIT